MKRILLLLVYTMAILGLATVASAVPLEISSGPVLMIDGTGDADADVLVLLINYDTTVAFGYIGAADTFQIINTGSASFAGGSVVDFAIREGDKDIIRASAGTAQMVFSGAVEASYSENPVVPFDYWKNLTITWELMNNDIVVNLSGHDGFAPAPVPEPATILLMGTGIIGLVAYGRRRAKKNGHLV